MYRWEVELYFSVSSSSDGVLAALVSFVGLRPLGLRLASQRLPVSLVCFQLVDVFRENLLVFEHVTSSLSGTGCDTCGSQYSSIHSVF